MSFNPRAPCGARRISFTRCTDMQSFNPRAPCGARQRLGLLCTTINQTINDLLRADGDNQVIQESLATVYYANGESFDSLHIDTELIPIFEHYKDWAIEYYDED